MIAVVWEYLVAPDRSASFEAMYGPAGPWADLFRHSAAYGGSHLIVDGATPGRYVLLDLFESAEAYLAFRQTHRAQYDALSRSCAEAGVWEREQPLAVPG